LVFPLIPVVLIGGTAISLALQGVDTFSPKEVKAVLVERKKESSLSNLSQLQIGGVPAIFIVVIGIIILLMVVLR